jgi:non-haem dioxygenase in morphine synthesis N-terminal
VALPVIDVAPLAGCAPAVAGVAVGEQIQSACRERGFFYMTGHGVPAGLLAELADASAELGVPKTCVTWADALGERSPVSSAGRAGLGPSGRAMIFGLWA